MKRYLPLIEATLGEVLPPADERPAVLSEAMRYAVGSGGKRIRPLVCLASAVAVGGRAEDARYPAAAIELIHNYTLIHDDLPAMDDDRERRGRPTVWVKFGEANAILAGDALQPLAFGVAARAPRKAAEIVAEFARYALGVVRGQVEDIGRSGDTAFVYEHKTADLFMAAAVTGALAGGGGEAEVEALRRYASALGLAFQYEDDLIDGDSPYPEARTRELVEEFSTAAVAALATLPGDTEYLETLVKGLIGRSR